MRVTTIGDGAMATVCSLLLAGKGHEARMWVRLPEDLAAFRAAGENTRYLPGYKTPPNLFFAADPAAALEDCDLILCAVPTQYIRGALTRTLPALPPIARNVPIVSVAKGIENDTLLRPTEIIRDVAGPRPLAVLSGPNIAGELARQLPATMVAASTDPTLAARVQELFTTPTLRVYRNEDVVGVELAGALKNVVAVAAGILDGMAMGNNCKAALLTRGLVEITRLGLALGAKAETFAGLAGLGDLVTTCVSPEGRNRSFGERVGRGEPADQALRNMVGVVEGVPTTRSVVELARRCHVEMPISEMLFAVLFQGKPPAQGIAELMRRELKHEAVDG